MNRLVFSAEAHHGLANALIFAAKDDTRPMLDNVLIAHADGVLDVVSTDAYMLYRWRSTIASAKQDDVAMVRECPTSKFSLLIPAEWLAEILVYVGGTKAPRYDRPSLEMKWDAADHCAPLVTVTVGRRSWKVPTHDGDFPRYDSLVPSGTTPTEAIALNPDLLARLPKLREPATGAKFEGTQPLVFHLDGPLKPVTIRSWRKETDMIVLQMPVRVP